MGDSRPPAAQSQAALATPLQGNAVLLALPVAAMVPVGLWPRRAASVESPLCREP